MSDFEVRPAVEGEQRRLFEVVGTALHADPVTDEFWEKRRKSFPADRKFGAFADGRPIGVASSLGTTMAVPGGPTVPTAAVDGVGVRADHTRRGVLTALMRAQLRDCVERGEVLAVLHASEATIYGRFGYGIATRSQDVRVVRHRAGFREDAPAGGRVRLIETDEAIELIPVLYHRIARGPGMIERPEQWWHYARHRLLGEHLVAVHTGPDGDDGFVLYRPVKPLDPMGEDAGVTLRVRDLHAANVAAGAGIWRFLLKIDLVSQVHAPARPLDEPLPVMLTDPRAAALTAVQDESWLRILDVRAALAARSYRPAAPVVLAVTDPVLQENTACYRVGPDGVSRTDEPAQLRLGVDVLAMLYLGEWSVSTLAAAGRIEVLDAGAVGRADELFRTPARPWCGTPF